ncbi:MAG: class II aldolase/adducin family protein, partial [Variovorax paradoxus]|nr:class II aldolase/adducin family protein [Variovorax paradoxus]
RVQVAIQSSGLPVYPVPAEVCEKTAQQYEAGGGSYLPGQSDPNAREWRAMLQRIEPAPATSFRD